LLIDEQIAAIAEIARELGLEHAALLVDEGVVTVGKVDETGWCRCSRRSRGCSLHHPKR
jgi:hypothetical protein